MTTIKFREWELIVDRELTKLTYEKVSVGGPESCGCNDCKNFANNRENIYPDEIKKLFYDLGVDYKKESEIWHYSRKENGIHCYSGWFHFKGHFKGKDCKIITGKTSSTFDLTAITESFSIGFCYDSSLSYFENKENLVQIEFDAKTTWTIDKELESE